MEPQTVLDRRRAALAAYMPSLEQYDLDGYPPGDHVGMPTTSITLVIPVDEPLDLSMPQATRRRFRACLAGLHDGPATIHHNGTQHGIQLALSPLHLRLLLGVPAAEIRGRAVELGDVIGERAADALVDRLASEPQRRTEVLEQLLLGRLDRHGRGGAVRAEVAHAWERLGVSGGNARIRDVAADVGWSTRHLTQQFSAELGLAPKGLARIMRFQRSTALVARGRGLAGVAAACGYADQAHMTREWGRLAGTTPTRWIRDDVLANVQYDRVAEQRASRA